MQLCTLPIGYSSAPSQKEKPIYCYTSEAWRHKRLQKVKQDKQKIVELTTEGKKEGTTEQDQVGAIYEDCASILFHQI